MSHHEASTSHNCACSEFCTLCSYLPLPDCPLCNIGGHLLPIPDVANLCLPTGVCVLLVGVSHWSICPLSMDLHTTIGCSLSWTTCIIWGALGKQLCTRYESVGDDYLAVIIKLILVLIKCVHATIKRLKLQGSSWSCSMPWQWGTLLLLSFICFICITHSQGPFIYHHTNIWRASISVWATLLPSLLLMPTSNIVLETSMHSNLLMHCNISLVILVLWLVCTGTSTRLVYYSCDHAFQFTWPAVDETSLHDKGSKASYLLLFQYWSSRQGPWFWFLGTWMACLAVFYVWNCSPSWALVGQPPCSTIWRTQQ